MPQDRHEELSKKNVLRIGSYSDEIASKYDIAKSALEDLVERCKRILYKARQERPRPHLDRKVVLSFTFRLTLIFSTIRVLVEASNHLICLWLHLMLLM